MKKNRTIYPLAAAAFLSASIAWGAAVPAGANPATVGDFVKRVAVLTGTQSGVVAKAKLESIADLTAAAPLTYGMVSRIAADLGIRVAPPANPDATMTVARAGAMASYVAAGLASASVEVPADPPDQCLNLDNRGACVDCCKTATGLSGQYCGRFCHANVVPPPSPKDPQP
jgi:hypothetical protein